MSIKWDKKNTLLLIKMFHENEGLWNHLHPDYTDRFKRAAGMRAIAKAFGPTFPIKEILRKIKNLNSHHLREKKRYESRKAREGDGCPPPRWFAYKHLGFLSQRRDTKRAALAADRQYVLTCPDVLNAAAKKGLEQLQNSQAVQTPLQQRPLKCKETATPRPQKRVEKKLPPAEPVPTAVSETSSSVRDEAGTFGEFIAFKLRRMDTVTMATVQHHIQNIIYQAEMGAYSIMPAMSPANFAVSTTADELEVDFEDPLNSTSPYSIGSGSDYSDSDTKPLMTETLPNTNTP